MRIRIRNSQTGEERVVSPQELSQYGLSLPSQQEQPQAPQENILTKIAGGLLPQASSFIKRGYSLLGAKAVPVEESVSKAQAGSRQLIERAMATKDPAEKERLLRLSRQISGKLEDISGQRYEQLTEPLMKKGKTISPAREATKSAAEIAAWMLPASKVKVGSGVKGALATGAVRNLPTGALFGMSSKEANTWRDIAKSSLTGAATGAAVGATMNAASKGIKTTWNVLTKKYPKILIATGLKADDKFADEVLKRKTPGGYKKMSEWGRRIENEAEERLQKVKTKGGATFKVDDFFTDPEEQKMFSDSISELSRELKRKMRTADSRKLDGAATNLFAGQATPQDVLTLKRYFDNSAQTTFKKSASAIGQIKQASRRIIGDRLRDVLRNSPASTKEISELLDTQRFAIRLQGYADAAYQRFLRSLVPSWWEISALLAGASAAGAGRPEYGAPILGAVALSRLLRTPQAAKTLYGVGEKAAKATPVAEALQEFLTKGITSGLNR